MKRLTSPRVTGTFWSMFSSDYNFFFFSKFRLWRQSFISRRGRRYSCRLCVEHISDLAIVSARPAVSLSETTSCLSPPWINNEREEPCRSAPGFLFSAVVETCRPGSCASAVYIMPSPNHLHTGRRGLFHALYYSSLVFSSLPRGFVRKGLR